MIFYQHILTHFNSHVLYEKTQLTSIMLYQEDVFVYIYKPFDGGLHRREHETSL